MQDLDREHSSKDGRQLEGSLPRCRVTGNIGLVTHSHGGLTCHCCWFVVPTPALSRSRYEPNKICAGRAYAAGFFQVFDRPLICCPQLRTTNCGMSPRGSTKICRLDLLVYLYYGYRAM